MGPRCALALPRLACPPIAKLAGCWSLSAGGWLLRAGSRSNRTPWAGERVENGKMNVVCIPWTKLPCLGAVFAGRRCRGDKQDSVARRADDRGEPRALTRIRAASSRPSCVHAARQACCSREGEAARQVTKAQPGGVPGLACVFSSSAIPHPSTGGVPASQEVGPGTACRARALGRALKLSTRPRCACDESGGASAETHRRRRRRQRLSAGA